MMLKFTMTTLDLYHQSHIEKELLRYNINVNRNTRLNINKNVRDHVRHEKEVAQDLARSTIDEKLRHWRDINKNFEDELEHDREIAFRRHYERRLLNVDKIKLVLVCNKLLPNPTQHLASL